MTEAEWNACTDPQPMLRFLRGKASDRKLRLFAVACCRRVWPDLTDERSRHAVEVAEQFADGGLKEEDLKEAEHSAWEAHHELEAYRSLVAFIAASTAGISAQNAASATAPMIESDDSDQCRANLLRSIFGPLPFRLVTLDPAWLTAIVIQLASAIYEERAFDRMPILGDALEEAGCSNTEILTHCRQPGEQVKGCWVVDLLLRKT
jgi:hypothetical protein